MGNRGYAQGGQVRHLPLLINHPQVETGETKEKTLVKRKTRTCEEQDDHSLGGWTYQRSGNHGVVSTYIQNVSGLHQLEQGMPHGSFFAPGSRPNGLLN